MTAFVKKLNRALLLLLFAVGVFCPLQAAAVAYEVDASIPVSVDVSENYQTAFTLQLTAVEDAPLPEQTQITFTGGGSGAFGPIHYTSPGDYLYQVSQQAGSDSQVSYDPSVYTVTVRVTDTPDGGLQADVWARHDSSSGKAEVVAFHNGYTAASAAGTVSTPTPSPSASPAPTQAPLLQGLLPQTGDRFPLTALLLLCVLAALGLLGGIFRRKNN